MNTWGHPVRNIKVNIKIIKLVKLLIGFKRSPHRVATKPANQEEEIPVTCMERDTLRSPLVQVLRLNTPPRKPTQSQLATTSLISNL